ncbi:UTRA domain-containing protein [Flavisphingomonas formosensis]|uniref:UTRA domain-containing protein n=1 Tax=Flavisphingomonas formosensis TaxID=861534 RepID=UPI0012F84B55|nr:UTRA domain-containing protein [Sphingomonas formosensis]
MTLEQRIRSDIEERIHSGEWPPGTRIPFEHELVERYGCARATVSKALESLARAGLIERRRKAGSFVAHPQVHSAVLDVPDLPQLIASRGEIYRWDRGVRRMALPSDLADETGIGRPALLIEGTHHSGASAFGIETRLIALDAVPDAAKESFLMTPPGTWLLSHTPWTQARHRIRAVAATGSVARRLGVVSGTACLELQRWTWRSGVPVTHVTQLFPGDRYDIVAEFKPGAQ